MEMGLKGRTALITGGSKGIGFGIARWFATEGVNLVLASRSADDLAEAARTIKDGHHVTVKTHALDLSDQKARDTLVNDNPDIDILINNAGAIPGGSIEDVNDEAWRKGWDLKVFGYINMTRAYLDIMKKRNKERAGVIINICGVGGERLDYGYAAGAAGNASLMALSRAIGGRSPDFGVRVLAVNPGPVETERAVYLAKLKAKKNWGDENRWRETFAGMPYKRPATVDETAAMVVFLASDHSHYISGTVVTIDGGIANRSALP